MNDVLKGHVSPETAYVVDDYPYGFRLRCKIRHWLESNKNGTRMWSQTTNPKVSGEVWNKPKASTYSPVMVMYLNEENHVHQNGIGIYRSHAEIIKFECEYGDAFTENDKKLVGAFAKIAVAMETRDAERKAKALEATG